MEPRLRSATDDDLPLVKETLYLALAWDPDDPIPPFEQVVDHPQLEIYHRGWMRRGDAGVVAEVDGSFAGMAYYRLFTDEVRGQGYLDARSPELAIAVVPERRGKGLGSRLLDAVAEQARCTGVLRISLSVSAGNPARRLYERHGYVPIGNGEVMVLTL